MPTPYRIIIPLLLGLGAAGCGHKGPLVLPAAKPAASAPAKPVAENPESQKTQGATPR